jgi:AcrR family transcriptional regulator
MGPEDSETRADLVQAAEQIIEEEGVSAVTTKRLAERLGLKRQIIHYYFRSIDDVILAVIRRKGEWYKAELARALEADDPLHIIWAMHGDPVATAAIFEFNALALRREIFRAETRQLVELARDIQARALLAYLERRGIAPPASPHVLIAILQQISLGLAVETAMGVALGHDRAEELVEQMLRTYTGLPELTLRPALPV